MDFKEPKPKDVQVIQAIIKEMGIQEYEHRVVNQLLEFAYRYVTLVLDDANVYSQFAKKKAIDADDIKLAIQLQVDKVFSNPPPRDLLLEITRQKNNQPLPPIKSQSGTRLPADRYSLTSCNYKLKQSNEILASQQQLAAQCQSSLRKSSLLTPGNLTRQAIHLQTQKSSSTNANRTTSTTNSQSLTNNPLNGSQSKTDTRPTESSDSAGQLKRKLDESDQ